MGSISERESREIEAANASRTTPVIFIHGLWLLPSQTALDFVKRFVPATPGEPAPTGAGYSAGWTPTNAL